MTGTNNQAAFQAAMFMQMAAMTFAAMQAQYAQQFVGHVQSPEAAAACRRDLHIAGLSEVPGPRTVKLSASERANLECKAKARKLGFAV